MSSIWIPGLQRVQGEIEIQGSKNAALPMMAAALLTEDEICLRNCPDILDIHSMAAILRCIGCEVIWKPGMVCIRKGMSASGELPGEETGRLRASGILMGALAGSGRKVFLPKTGGCVIGERPMDLHYHALCQLGYRVEAQEDGNWIYDDGNVRPAKIHFAYPSVGATENSILASVLLPGVTELYGVAREPEIEDLCALLNQMGAKIEGAGEESIRIQGVRKLYGTSYEVMADRIAAGTYLMAAAATEGELCVYKMDPEHLAVPLRILRNMGYRIDTGRDTIHIRPSGYKVPGQIQTGPYPKFPTDLQPLMMPVMLSIRGMSIIRETVFENRMGTAKELKKMQARVRVEARRAILYGSQLQASCVIAPDPRGGAALCIAALNAEGITRIDQAERIDRGYEDIVRDLAKMNIYCYR